jgi:hypothetical protein
MGSFSARIWRACRPALEAKTKVPAIASRKARPTASVRRHGSPTIQYSRFPSGTFRSLLLSAHRYPIEHDLFRVYGMEKVHASADGLGRG